MYQVRRRKLIIAVSILLLLLGGVVIFLLTRQLTDVGVGLADRNDGECVIGWTNSHQLIRSTTASGYLPYQTLDAAKPAGATIKVFDLNNGAGSIPLTTTNLADVDILFVTDQGDNSLRTNYVNPTAAQLNIIRGEFNTGMRVVTTSDNAGSALNTGVQYAAMMSMPVVNALSGGAINFRDRYVITDQVTGLTTSTYPFLNGLTYDTRGTGLRSPGIVDVTAPGTCAALINIPENRGGGTSCIISYLPPTSTSGFLLVDTNAGQISRELVTSGAIWDQVPDCAPVPPPQCGNGTVETGETCDAGTDNGVACTAPYGGSCNYCTSECLPATVPGAFCGDDERNGAEECDGQDVADGQQCNVSCEILDPLSTLKASTIESINSEEAIVQYTVTVTNPNAQEVQSRVVDQLPTFVQAGDVTEISNGGTYDATTDRITWESLIIPANGNVVLTYSLRVRAADYGTFTNTAVTYDSEGNEDSRDTEEVTLDVDLQAVVNKTHTESVTAAGTVVNYTLAIQNTSAVQLVNLRVVDTLPGTVQSSWVGAISDGGTLSGSTITWTGITLNAGASASRTYTITYPTGTSGTFTNNVVVFDSQNNELSEDTDTITIVPPVSSSSSSSSTTTSTETSSETTTSTPPSSTISTTISSSSIPASTTTSAPSLPDTALLDQPSDLIIFGFTLIVLGGIAYKFGFGTQLGQVLVDFTSDRASSVADNLKPDGFESKAEKDLRRKINKKIKK